LRAVSNKAQPIVETNSTNYITELKKVLEARKIK
jgi:hypothetical protein